MTNLQKNETIRKFRAAIREILIKLKLRKPNSSKKIVIGKIERDMHGTVDDSELRTRSSSIKSVLSNYNSSNSDHESVTSYEEDVLGSQECGDEIILSDDSYVDWSKVYSNRDIVQSRRINFESEYYEYSTSYYTKKKRWPNTGLNFSKIPILSEIPKIPNPAAWVTSKTQKDTKPIRN